MTCLLMIHHNRAAADVLYEVLTIMVKKGPLSVGRSDEL